MKTISRTSQFKRDAKRMQKRGRDLERLRSGVGARGSAQEASLILTGARIRTGDAERPWAAAVALREDEILAVGETAEVMRHRGEGTRVLDLPGRFVAAGSIASHTHFDMAGALLLGVNLLEVANEEGLIEAVRGARERLPRGAWIVGGDWGAYEAWESGSTGAEPGTKPDSAFRPHRSMIEAIPPENPVLLSRWDHTLYLD